MVLGIGGVKALKALGIDVDIYHFNEGHAVFAGTELLRRQMDDKGLSFEEALQKVRKKIVFQHIHRLKQAMRFMIMNSALYGCLQRLTYGQMLKAGGEPFK
jgi:starch phosphorylase